MTLRAAATIASLLLTAATLAGCSAEADPSVDIVVYAAASLTGPFSELADRFEAANPETSVTLNFAGSSALASGILSGAPVDVFAAANPQTMMDVTDASLAERPVVFAGNTLEIAVPVGNPGDITGLDDFADPGKVIALCAPEVPCGAAANEVFDLAGIVPAPDTLEEDVKGAITKVELGEVDAALVYRTDVLAAGDAVEGIEFAEAERVVNDYLIVTLGNAPNADAAAAFVSFVRGKTGREVLADAGFTAP